MVYNGKWLYLYDIDIVISYDFIDDKCVRDKLSTNLKTYNFVFFQM